MEAVRPMMFGQQSNVISIQNWTQSRPLPVYLRSSADLEHAAHQLMSFRAVEVHLEGMDEEVARRTLHFLSGVVYAKGGSIRRVKDRLFFLSGGPQEAPAPDDPVFQQEENLYENP